MDRRGTDVLWKSAQWSIRLNNQEVSGGDIFFMLNSFHEFTDNRQIDFK
jgi:hypothetical protein